VDGLSVKADGIGFVVTKIDPEVAHPLLAPPLLSVAVTVYVVLAVGLDVTLAPEPRLLLQA
jgi:hypothetical protein